jgi:3-hydroxyacyl-CoA dehydrogenase/enoyl-CoA hydratase/carnithine racemase
MEFDEVITKAIHREVDLTPFGFNGKLSLITLDNGMDHTRPNTLGPKSLAEFDAAISVAQNADTSAIAVIGKPFIFMAGADLSVMSYIENRDQALEIGQLGHKIYRRLLDSKKPTFAFINGLALGGGTEIGLNCHYRTIASTSFIALPEVFLGLIPGWGGATLLPKLIGPEAAVQVIIANPLNNNHMLKAKEAAALGMVDEVYEPVEFLEKSVAFAANILSGKKKIERKDHSNDDWQTPLATAQQLITKKYGNAKVASPYRAIKLIESARTASITDGFAAEDEALADLIMGEELRASIYAFNLMQKSRKKVVGAPKASLARKVSKVGVVGAGLMASQLALLIIRNLKVPVVISDVDQSRVDVGIKYLHSEIDKLVEKKRINTEMALRLKSLIHGTVDKKDYAGCDFIIEAIFEELSLKQSLFRELENHISPECILATNTSSLSVTKMGEGLKNPERVIGFHFFNPVAVMPLLEIARTPSTNDETTSTAVAIGKELKKVMVIVKDSPGFVVNRLLMRFMGEITDAIDEGTPAEVADSAMAPLGLPMSPLALLGLVGPGVALHVAQTLHDNLGDRYRVSPTITNFVKNGVKTFYVKDGSGKLIPNPEALAQIASGNKSSNAEEVKVRALKAMASEAKLMLDEGVVSGPTEIDLCMLLGAGWPMNIGGILPYLDREGISEAVCGSRFHPPGLASLK